VNDSYVLRMVSYSTIYHCSVHSTYVTPLRRRLQACGSCFALMEIHYVRRH